VFVPDDFEAPRALTGTSESGAVFRLEPLAVEHNQRDYRAWTSSIDHIRSSPGFAEWTWPHPMTLDDNARDLIAHADDFAARRGFTYTVLDADDDVIGCVYIYPDDDGAHDAHVRSWVRADHAELDAVLRAAVAEWVRSAWPFRAIRYEGGQNQ
jgi:Acetyltransferase (GNAT) domain